MRFCGLGRPLTLSLGLSLVFSLGFSLGFSAVAGTDRPINYSDQTLSFGSNGERVDLALNFHADFLKKFAKRLKEPNVILWLTELGACHDSEPDCILRAHQVPHCRLSAVRSDFPGQPLLQSDRYVGPLKNLNYNLQTKIENGNILSYGVDALVWESVDPVSKVRVRLECAPAPNHKNVEFTKNVFNRIVGDAFQYVAVLRTPEEVEKELDSKTETSNSQNPKKEASLNEHHKKSTTR